MTRSHIAIALFASTLTFTMTARVQAQAAAALAAPADTEEDRMRMLVVDAATFGIDPVVGQAATARMREHGRTVGYDVLSREQTVEAAQALRMPFPPSPADLWQLCVQARVHRGAFARVWAHGGRYVIEIVVASLDGTGPYFARGTAGADDLREVTERLMAEALVPPSRWNEAGATQVGTTVPAEPETPPAAATPPPRERDDEPEMRRFALTLQTEAGFGVSQEGFYNHLAGARLDLRLTQSISLGAYVGYANLSGRDGRVNNLIFMAQFENRIRFSSDFDLTLPLRVSLGYVPFNGPVLRFSAGLNYAITERWEVGIDLFSPTFWFLPESTAISLDVGLELTYRL